MCEGHPTRETLLLNIGGLAEQLSELMGRVDELEERIKTLEALVPPVRQRDPGDPFGLRIVPLPTRS